MHHTRARAHTHTKTAGSKIQPWLAAPGFIKLSHQTPTSLIDDQRVITPNHRHAPQTISHQPCLVHVSSSRRRSWKMAATLRDKKRGAKNKTQDSSDQIRKERTKKEITCLVRKFFCFWVL
jgi:hypothetical protein